MKQGVWINNAFVESSTDDVLRVVDSATEDVVDEVRAGGIWINDPLVDNVGGSV